MYISIICVNEQYKNLTSISSCNGAFFKSWTVDNLKPGYCLQPVKYRHWTQHWYWHVETNNSLRKWKWLNG